MKKHNEFAGKRFGRLTVIQRSGRKIPGSGNIQWLCKCDCGKFLIVRSDNLASGHTTKCSDCGTRGGKISVFVKGSDLNGVV